MVGGKADVPAWSCSCLGGVASHQLKVSPSHKSARLVEPIRGTATGINVSRGVIGEASCCVEAVSHRDGGCHGEAVGNDQNSKHSQVDGGCIC